MDITNGNWAFDIANEDWAFDIASGNWAFDIANEDWAFDIASGDWAFDSAKGLNHGLWSWGWIPLDKIVLSWICIMGFFKIFAKYKILGP